MARILSCSYNYPPALSPVATASNSVKPHSTLVLSVLYFNKPIQLVGNVHQDRKLPMVARYRGGRGYDAIFSDEDEEEEEELAEREDDPNVDLARINSSTVRLLDEENNMLGVVPLKEAMRRSESPELILTIVSADQDPPVLRIFKQKEYRKHQYEKQRKQRDRQKKQVNRLKEIKIGYGIDEHDYAVRQNQARKFLREGHKVKVIISLRGRENQHRTQAIDQLKQFQNDLGQLASEQSKNFVHRNMYIVLRPNKANIQREQQQNQREEELKKKQQAETSIDEQLKKQEQEASASTEEISANV